MQTRTGRAGRSGAAAAAAANGGAAAAPAGAADGSIHRVPLLFRAASQEDLTSPIDRRSELYRKEAASARGRGAPVLRRQKLLTPPNVLTFARVVLVPVFAALWFWDHRLSSVSAAAVFIAASVTDWLDGYLARRLKITSAFGAFLDPVADKLMVSTALVLLATAPPAPLGVPAMAAPVCAIIAREITMSSLREWAAASGGGAHRAVKVNSLGKWKTALQMVALSALLLLRDADRLLGAGARAAAAVHAATRAAYALLLVAAALALASLANYFTMVWHYFIHVWEHPEEADAGGKDR